MKSRKGRLSPGVEKPSLPLHMPFRRGERVRLPAQAVAPLW
ncbi:MAG: hypothetical protein ACM3XZ_04560 [Betaproteobacteria bacterium]